MSHLLAHYDGCLDLFRGVPTNLLVESSKIVEHAPLGFSPDTSTTLLFDIGPSDNMFIDLNATQLYLKLKLVNGDGTNRNEAGPAADLVGPVNNIMYSLFSQLDVSLNGTPVTASNPFYPYKVFLETWLGQPYSVKKHQLERCGFYQDLVGNQDDLVALGANGGLTSGNIALMQRLGYFVGNRTADFIGPLYSDIFTTERLLIPGVGMRVTFTPAKPAFTLMAGPGSDYRIKIMEAALCIRYVKVLPAAVSHIEDMLKSHPAIYPLHHSYIKAYNIPAGSMSDIRDNFLVGPVPELLIVTLVGNSRVVGTWNQTPYLFEPFHLSSISVSVDSVSVPGKPLQFDADSRYVRAYDRMFTQTGINSKYSVGIRLDTYRYYFLLCYNLKPDGGDSTVAPIPRNGNLRIELNFHQALEHTTTVLCYLQFSKVLQINANREVIYDLP